MSDAAQPTSQLLSKMRGAFQQSGSSVASGTSQQPTPQIQQQEIQSEETEKKQPIILSTDQKLDALDSVLTTAEQQSQDQLSQPEPQQQVQIQEPQEVPQQVVEPAQQQPEAQPVQAVVPPVVPQQPIQARQQNMGMVAQATPVAVDQALLQQQQLQAAQSGGSVSKEAITGGVDTSAVEAGATVQYVEQEQTPELSPEVSGYLQHVQDHATGEPQELVVGEAQQSTPLPTNYQKKAVVVLPISPDVEKKGARKGPLNSIRWLVEWSRKLMKMFSGEIIYKEVEK